MAVKGKGKEKQVAGKAPATSPSSSVKRKSCATKAESSLARGKKRRSGVLQFVDDAAGEADVDEVKEDEDLEWEHSDDIGFGLGGKDVNGSTKVPVKSSSLPVFIKQEEMDDDELEEAIRQRYCRDSDVVSYAEDVKGCYETEYLVHTPEDLSIWSVKCMVGRERQAAFCLMQKFVDLKKVGKMLQIVSVLSVDHVKGFVYIEADKACNVFEACKGLYFLYASRVDLVPKNEAPNLLTIQSKASGISKGTWVRMKSGKYKGDLAEVVSLNDVKKRVTIKLVPRIDLRAIAKKFGGGTSLKASDIPAPRLISSHELDDFRPHIEVRRDRETGEIFEVLDGLMLKDGYLYKKVCTFSLIHWGVQPSSAELMKFENMAKDEVKNASWLSSVYKAQMKKHHETSDPKDGEKSNHKGGYKPIGKDTDRHSQMNEDKQKCSFDLDDLVLFGKKGFGIILDKENDSVKILNGDIDGPVEVTIKAREIKKNCVDKVFTASDRHSKLVNIDDVVKVAEGPLEGREGIVRHMYKGILFIYDECQSEKNGFFCAKSEICNLLKKSRDFSGKKGCKAGPSFSQSANMYPNEEEENSQSFGRGRQSHSRGTFSIGQTLRICKGPLKGYLCRVVRIHRADVMVKLDSLGKLLTVDEKLLSQPNSRYAETTMQGDIFGSQNWQAAGVMMDEGKAGGSDNNKSADVMSCFGRDSWNAPSSSRSVQGNNESKDQDQGADAWGGKQSSLGADQDKGADAWGGKQSSLGADQDQGADDAWGGGKQSSLGAGDGCWNKAAPKVSTVSGTETGGLGKTTLPNPVTDRCWDDTPAKQTPGLGRTSNWGETKTDPSSGEWGRSEQVNAGETAGLNAFAAPSVEPGSQSSSWEKAGCPSPSGWTKDKPTSAAGDDREANVEQPKDSDWGRGSGWSQGGSRNEISKDTTGQVSGWSQGGSRNEISKDTTGQVSGWSQGGSRSEISKDTTGQASGWSQGGSRNESSNDTTGQVSGWSQGGSRSEISKDTTGQVSGWSQGGSRNGSSQDLAQGSGLSLGGSKKESSMDWAHGSGLSQGGSKHGSSKDWAQGSGLSQGGSQEEKSKDWAQGSGLSQGGSKKESSMDWVRGSGLSQGGSQEEKSKDWAQGSVLTEGGSMNESSMDWAQGSGWTQGGSNKKESSKDRGQGSSWSLGGSKNESSKEWAQGSGLSQGIPKNESSKDWGQGSQGGSKNESSLDWGQGSGCSQGGSKNESSKDWGQGSGWSKGGSKNRNSKDWGQGSGCDSSRNESPKDWGQGSGLSQGIPKNESSKDWGQGSGLSQGGSKNENSKDWGQGSGWSQGGSKNENSKDWGQGSGCSQGGSKNESSKDWGQGSGYDSSRNENSKDWGQGSGWSQGGSKNENTKGQGSGWSQGGHMSTSSKDQGQGSGWSQDGSKNESSGDWGQGSGWSQGGSMNESSRNKQRDYVGESVSFRGRGRGGFGGRGDRNEDNSNHGGNWRFGRGGRGQNRPGDNTRDVSDESSRHFGRGRGRRGRGQRRFDSPDWRNRKENLGGGGFSSKPSSTWASNEPSDWAEPKWGSEKPGSSIHGHLSSPKEGDSATSHGGWNSGAELRPGGWAKQDSGWAAAPIPGNSVWDAKQKSHPAEGNSNMLAEENTKLKTGWGEGKSGKSTWGSPKDESRNCVWDAKEKSHPAEGNSNMQAEENTGGNKLKTGWGDVKSGKSTWGSPKDESRNCVWDAKEKNHPAEGNSNMQAEENTGNNNLKTGWGDVKSGKSTWGSPKDESRNCVWDAKQKNHPAEGNSNMQAEENTGRNNLKTGWGDVKSGKSTWGSPKDESKNCVWDAKEKSHPAEGNSNMQAEENTGRNNLKTGWGDVKSGKSTCGSPKDESSNCVWDAKEKSHPGSWNKGNNIQLGEKNTGGNKLKAGLEDVNSGKSVWDSPKGESSNCVWDAKQKSHTAETENLGSWNKGNNIQRAEKNTGGNKLKAGREDVNSGKTWTPAEASPAEASPAEESPAEASPAEASPAEASPAEASPAEASPAGCPKR